MEFLPLVSAITFMLCKDIICVCKSKSSTKTASKKFARGTLAGIWTHDHLASQRPPKWVSQTTRSQWSLAGNASSVHFIYTIWRWQHGTALWAMSCNRGLFTLLSWGGTKFSLLSSCAAPSPLEVLSHVIWPLCLFGLAARTDHHFLCVTFHRALPKHWSCWRKRTCMYEHKQCNIHLCMRHGTSQLPDRIQRLGRTKLKHIAPKNLLDITFYSIPGCCYRNNFIAILTKLWIFS